MDTIFLWIHPIMQTVALYFGLFALFYGVKRFQMNLGKKVIFPWKKHVKYGAIALILWLLGSFGFYVTLSVFGGTHITGLHAELAYAAMIFAVLAFITGAIMEKNKKKRKFLPIIHGALALIVVLIVFFEVYTGLEIAPSFLGL